MIYRFKVFFIIFPTIILTSPISLGIDAFLSKENLKKYQGKKIAVITNHTAISSKGILTIDRLLEQKKLIIKKIFAPEHGFYGDQSAGSYVNDAKYKDTIPIISLHGSTRRPSKKMLEDVEVLIYDIQDIGCRSYTYASTLFYAMEEAKKYGIEVCVLDRPNPMGGTIYDGPMLQKKHRSFIGYINVPYCHGMTIAELALFFNKEYNVHCKLSLFLLDKWDKDAPFTKTGLLWVPTSPNIPESDTPFFYATTGCLGELGIVDIGIGTSFPFKVVGAPWINAEKFSNTLNKQNLPGTIFTPFFYTPKCGKHKDILCKGVKIHITNSSSYLPCKTGNMIIGMLKSLYPNTFKEKLLKAKKKSKHFFQLAQGNSSSLSILTNDPFPAYSLINKEKKDHQHFHQLKKKYSLYQ